MGVPGIVNILDKDLKSCGTGFFSSPEEYIITCFHVLSSAGYHLPVRSEYDIVNYCDAGGAAKQAEWIGGSANRDIAVLRADGPECHGDV
ncbi:MAG: serine protease [Clostridiales Family XIII bacterium]|jgi:S1-C subfamily serine protease|nr:serine protease [Clostridiales Family XIII bacterium]